MGKIFDKLKAYRQYQIEKHPDRDWEAFFLTIQIIGYICLAIGGILTMI